MSITDIHRLLPALALAAVVAGAPALVHAGDDPEMAEETKHYAADRLVVQGLAASALSIAGEARSDIQLTIRGAAEDVERVRAELRGSTLHLSSEPDVVTDGASVTTIVGPGRNVVIVRGGGRASTSIGSVSQSVAGHGRSVVTVDGVTIVTGPAAPLEVDILVPLDAGVEVDAYVGEIRMSDLRTPLHLALAGGRADLERIAGGRLAIQGSGEIDARDVRGDLAVDIAGSGSVQVAQAELGRLEVEIAGAGRVGIAGRAERARLGIAGSGVIEVDEVAERPDVSILGAGRVRVGNW